MSQNIFGGTLKIGTCGPKITIPTLRYANQKVKNTLKVILWITILWKGFKSKKAACLILFLCKSSQLLMNGPSALNTTINTSQSWIKTIQKEPVLHKLPYTKLKHFHNFGPLSFYGTTRYKWAHIHYKKHRTWFSTKTRLTKIKPAWVY